MNVPLDRLYNFIDNISEEIYGNRVIIYRFLPHGSKKLEDLDSLHDYSYLTWKQLKLTPELYCNDQEPLDFDLYEDIKISSVHKKWQDYIKHLSRFDVELPKKNFRICSTCIWDKALLLHSEQRSINLIKYEQNDFLSVYYWAHGIIARDWFRFAEHVKQKKQNHKTFLVYSRAWTGTREYRLKFLELVALSGLNQQCLSNIQPIDQTTGRHYDQYRYQNPIWKCNSVLENYYQTKSIISADFSADFDIRDYEQTQIEVVLETLFDDDRIHLTEKILRPIALGQPFILASTHGALNYLRHYGFQTFSSVWSEDYDLEPDPFRRMQKIVELMEQISKWTELEKNTAMEKARAIALANKQHFFSKEFFSKIITELKSNFSTAFEQLEKTNTSKDFLNIRNQMFEKKELWESLLQIRSQQDADEIYSIVLEYFNRTTPISNT